MDLELKEIEESEYIELINKYSCSLGIVYNRDSYNVVAFSYVREGINYFYKVVEK